VSSMPASFAYQFTSGERDCSQVHQPEGRQRRSAIVCATTPVNTRHQDCLTPMHTWSEPCRTGPMDMTPAREYIGRSCSPTENAEEAARHDVTRKVFMSDHRRNLAQPAEEKRGTPRRDETSVGRSGGEPKDVRDVFCKV